VEDDGCRHPLRAPADDSASPSSARPEGGFVWVDVVDPTEATLAGLVDTLPLPRPVLNDVARAHHRPVLHHDENAAVVVVKPARFDEITETLTVAELVIVLLSHGVLTVRRGHVPLPPGDGPWPGASGSAGPPGVLLDLLSLTVDGYDAAIAALEDDLEEIEVAVFTAGDGGPAARIYGLKQQVLELRRAVFPVVGILERLAADELGPQHDALRQAFRDVHDRCLRAADATDRADRLLSEVLQAHLAQVAVAQTEIAVRQNEDMRRISAWAAIGLVPTAIAGIYGMNFDTMPELRTRYGYYVVLGVILLICLTLYRTFRRRDWL
jgi:magnesium transporter